MAVKIVRQPGKIALLGVPSSAAALSAGPELAPSALRAAGLVERLKSVGYDVADLGDNPPQSFKPDDESPRARNVVGVIAMLDALKSRVEQAVKSSALPIVLSGDRSSVLSVVAGARRYFKNVGAIYVAPRAGLKTPATTRTGSLDEMVASHLTGRGAAELVRFWTEPPLVRDPDLVLFGIDPIDVVEEDLLRQSPIRSYSAEVIESMGAASAAQAAVDRIHGGGYQFILHLDVGIIAGFPGREDGGGRGLPLEDVRTALEVFAKQKHLATIVIAAYNPAADADRSGAKIVVELLAGILAARLASLSSTEGAEPPLAAVKSPEPAPPAAAEGAADAPLNQQEVAPASTETSTQEAKPGQAWSSEALVDEYTPSADVAPPETSTAPEEPSSHGDNESDS